MLFMIYILKKKIRSGETAKDESQKAPNQRRNLEEEYLSLESKVCIILILKYILFIFIYLQYAVCKISVLSS